MASGFAYALAGGVKGFGEGLVAQAQAEREASRERIRMMFQREERVAGQEFTLERDDAGREFTTSEREASQGFQAAENARTRAAAASRETKGDTITLADGTIGTLKDGVFTPATGPDGNPIKGATKGDTDKGELITMEDGTLGVRRGDKVTPVTGPDDKPVKGAAKDTSHASRASVFKTMLESIKSSDSGFDMSPEEQAAEAQRLTDQFFMPSGRQGGGAVAPVPGLVPDAPADEGEVGSEYRGRPVFRTEAEATDFAKKNPGQTFYGIGKDGEPRLLRAPDKAAPASSAPSPKSGLEPEPARPPETAPSGPPPRSIADAMRRFDATVPPPAPAPPGDPVEISVEAMGGPRFFLAGGGEVRRKAAPALEGLARDLGISPDELVRRIRSMM